jgi:chromosome segregation ATPase
MMVSYATVVKSITEESIEQTVEWFEDHMDALRHLEENGFNVQPLQRTLTKLSQIKSDDAHCIKKIGKLDAEIAGRTSSLSRIDELLDELDAAVAELKQKLGHLRQESQKIAKEKRRSLASKQNATGLWRHVTTPNDSSSTSYAR